MNSALVSSICFSWSLFCCATDGCPANCTCEFNNVAHEGHVDLIISCADRQVVEPDTALSQEIDVMLADVTQIQALAIQHSSLTQIPASVCALTSLELLNLDNNRLVALPNNCLSRLSELERFSACNNSIAYLQVLMVFCIALRCLAKLRMSRKSRDPAGQSIHKCHIACHTIVNTIWHVIVQIYSRKPEGHEDEDILLLYLIISSFCIKPF